MEALNLEQDEHIQHTISQSLSCEIVPVLLVLLLPLSMILFSNSPIGVFVGITFLLFILFGIFTIYTKLFNKKIILTNKRIIIKENRYTFYPLQSIKKVDFQQTLFNRFCGIGTIVLDLEDCEIRINNITIKDKEKILKQR